MSKKGREQFGIDYKNDCTSIYVVRNNKVVSEYKDMDRKIVDIILRSMSSMIKRSAQNDIVRIYEISKRDGIDFNYVAIPPEYVYASTEVFDQESMAELYKLGYDTIKAGNAWQKKPRGVD